MLLSETCYGLMTPSQQVTCAVSFVVVFNDCPGLPARIHQPSLLVRSRRVRRVLTAQRTALKHALLELRETAWGTLFRMTVLTALTWSKTSLSICWIEVFLPFWCCKWLASWLLSVWNMNGDFLVQYAAYHQLNVIFSFAFVWHVPMLGARTS